MGSHMTTYQLNNGCVPILTGFVICNTNCQNAFGLAGQNKTPFCNPLYMFEFKFLELLFLLFTFFSYVWMYFLIIK